MLTTRAGFLTVLLTASLSLTACAGGDDDAEDAPEPDTAMADAKKTLDETSGVEIAVDSEDLPDDTSGIVLVSASGTGIHPSSFEGDITGRMAGITQDGKVTAIDGQVWIDLPILGPGYEEVDPADYGAPDPSQLIATEGGLSDLLVETEDLEQGEQTRGGANNDEVLNEYTGTLEGEQVKVLIPIAAGDSFDVTYQITSESELRQMAITGEFYEGTGDMTYTVDFDNYGAEADITEP